MDLWLMCPVMRDPPIYTLADLRTWVTLDDVLDAYEIMALEGMANEKARRNSELRN